MSSKQDISQDINVTATRDTGCKIKAEVTLGSEASKRAYKEAVAAVRKKVSLPGFRKGRAPDKLVCEHFDSQIESEFRQRALSLSFLAVMDKEKVRPLNQNNIKGNVEKLSKEEGFATLEFETVPEIPTVAIESLSSCLVKPEPITDEEIDNNLKKIREEEGNWEPVEPRAIAEGDHVLLTIKALGDAEAKDDESVDEPRDVCENHRFHAKAGEMGKWMLDLIVGKNPGDTVEGVSERDNTLPEDAPFIATRYSITIGDLLTCTPLSDEELCKIFEKESFDEVRKVIREKFEMEKESEAHHQTKNKISSLLIENYSFDLPFSVIESQRQTQIKRAIRVLKSEGKDDEAIKKLSPEIEETVAENNRQRLTHFFLANKYFGVADSKKLEITNDEMKSAYFRELLLPPTGASVIDREMKAEELRSVLSLSIIIDRFLTQLAKEISQ